MMRRYTYKDTSFGKGARPTSGHVIFACDAESLLAADALLREATGHIAIKDATIWCSFEDVPVAQLDRASVSETEGRTFESCQERHEN